MLRAAQKAVADTAESPTVKCWKNQLFLISSCVLPQQQAYEATADTSSVAQGVHESCGLAYNVRWTWALRPLAG